MHGDFYAPFKIIFLKIIFKRISNLKSANYFDYAYINLNLWRFDYLKLQKQQPVMVL